MTKSKLDFGKHRICAYALFFAGNALLTVPNTDANTLNLCALGVAVVLSVLFYLFSYAFFEKADLFNEEKKTVFKCILSGLILLLCFYEGATAFASLIEFFKKGVLLKTPKIAISIVFILSLYYASTKDEKTLFKFSLVTAPLCFLATVILFITSAENFNFKYLIFENFSVRSFTSQTITYLFQFLFSSLLIGVFDLSTGLKKGIFAAGGIAVGGIALLICVLNSVLIFGYNYSAQMDFPYASALSTVSVGEIFTRMDGISYFVFFVTCFVKCVAIMLTVRTISGIWGIKNKRFVLLVTSIIFFAASFVL